MKRFLPFLLGAGLFLAGCGGTSSKAPPVAAKVIGDRQEVDIFVEHAYKPNDIVLKPGMPAQLNFFRKERTESCAKDLEIPALGVQVELPNHKVYMVKVPPQKPGTVILFHCSMKMMTGQITVSES